MTIEGPDKVRSRFTTPRHICQDAVGLNLHSTTTSALIVDCYSDRLTTKPRFILTVLQSPGRHGRIVFKFPS